MTADTASATGVTPVRSVAERRVAAAGLVLAVLAAALGGLAHLGETQLAVGTFAVQIVLALAWTAALDARGSAGVVLLGVLAAGVADGVLAGDSALRLGAMAAIGGVGLVAGLLHQLARRPRPGVVASLGAAGSLILLELALSSPLALRAVIPTAADAVAAGMFGVAAAALVGRLADLIVRRPPIAPYSGRGLVGTILGLAAAAAVGALWGHDRLGGAGTGVGGRIAVIAAVLAVVGDVAVDLARSAETDDRVRSALAPLAASFPLALAGPAVYVAARYLLG